MQTFGNMYCMIALPLFLPPDIVIGTTWNPLGLVVVSTSNSLCLPDVVLAGTPKMGIKPTPLNMEWLAAHRKNNSSNDSIE